MYSHQIHPIPFERIRRQITELIGLIKIVPPLIDADRERRWDEIGNRTDYDPNSDLEQIDLYERESGPEEGWGHAEYDRVIYTAAIVTAWEEFRAYLVRELVETTLNCRPLARIVADECKQLDRNYSLVIKRYEHFLEIDLREVMDMDTINHAQELRNALVHNHGLYTENYLKTKLARRPAVEDFLMVAPKSDAELINAYTIPLNREFVRGIIDNLLAAATALHDTLHGR